MTMLNAAGGLTPCFFRNAILFGGALMITACASTAAPEKSSAQFGAYGYLLPNPDATPEFIGVFPSKKECDDAAKAWTTQQVVGNPVRAECYPVDTH